MYLFKNNATSTLRQDTPAASVSLTLPSGEGARFPAPVAPDIATVTIEDRRTGQLEICTMTSRVADVMTVIRGQEGTTAQLFYAGSTVSNRMTAGTLAGIQTLGTFFYAGPYTVAQPPGPAPGAVGDAGQIMPSPIPPGTQYYNVGQKVVYVWDGTNWIAYTGMVPLDGHLAMIGNLQMGGHAVLSQGSGDHLAIDGGGGHANALTVDGNSNTIQAKRLTTHTAFPVAVPGELVANIPDAQLAMGPGAAGPAVPLIAVRYFQETTTYLTGDHVVQAGVLLRAKVDISPGVFNGAAWASASGGIPEAPIDGTPYLRKDGNWIGPSGALVVTDAPNDGNEYVRKSLDWTLHDKTWAGITGKPTTFPPSTHTHPISEVSGLQTTLNNEEAARIAGDSALQGQISTNITAIANEQTRAIADVDSEEAARIAADTALSTAISTETTNRIADVDAEEAARIAADAALTTAVNGKVGPDAPSDGYQYARKNAAWEKVTGGALISATPPAGPLPSSFWWESDTGNLFIRYDDGNSAQWIQVNYSPLTTDYVLRAGDTMTGALIVKPVSSGANLILDKPTSGAASSAVWGYTNGLPRWVVVLGSNEAESTGNAGSNFQIARYSDAGTILDVPLTITRANGTVSLTKTLQATSYTCKPGNAGGYRSNSFVIDYTGTVPQLWIDNTNFGTFSFVSDYRTKENIEALPSMWEAVKALRPVSFDWKEFGVFKPDGTEGPQYGFIAHELQEDLIQSAANGDKDEENRIQNLNLAPVVAALTKALQEAMARIEALEAGR